jgi:hypothetical protein
MGMYDLSPPRDCAFYGATGHTGSELRNRGPCNGKT